MLEKLTLTVAIAILLQLLAVNNPIFNSKYHPDWKPHESRIEDNTFRLRTYSHNDRSSSSES